MSLECTIVDNVFVITARGSTPFEEAFLFFKSIASTPEFSPPAKVLFDTRQTDYTPPMEDLESMAYRLSKLDAYRGGRWASVAVSGSLHFGVSHTFKCLAEIEGLKTAVFSDYDAALAWLRG